MKKYTNQEGMNINTFHLLFESNADITIDMQISKGLFEADMLTYYKHTLLNDFIYNNILNPIFYPNIKKIGKYEYTYLSIDEHFDFVLLNKYFNELLKNMPNEKKKLIKNYKNACRAGSCQYSIVLACCLEKSKLVIGNMPIKDGRNVLHRFVIVEKNGQQYVLDIAKNLIMKKEDYYQISKFEELGSISSENLRAIYNFALETGICSHSGIISMFGNELINDLEKNKLIRKNYSIPDFSSFVD